MTPNQTYLQRIDVPIVLIEGVIEAADDTPEWLALWRMVGEFTFNRIHRRRLLAVRQLRDALLDVARFTKANEV